MPLLGRHKSLPSTNQTGHKQQQHQNPPPLVCESPLFGTRRQLPVSSSSQTHGAGSKHQSLSAKSSLNAAASSRPHSLDTSDTLGSIPKQISRQQIHYAFSIMDTNSDGLIDLRDLSQMLANLGVPIDEAILSHVMSSVSKRGDHRISEPEFLDWLANFIQVSGGAHDSKGAHETRERKSPATRLAAGRQQATGGARPKNSVVRSASSSGTASALVAQSSEAQQLVGSSIGRRRGSGSGLALMRSLSSASTNAGLSDSDQQKQKQPEVAQSTRALAGNGRPDDEQQQQQQEEARQDLKAAFCVFDLDGDGFITIDEVQQGLKLLGESWSLAELNRLLFSKCDSQPQVAAKRTSRAADVAQSRQRISIEDFVKLLL